MTLKELKGSQLLICKLSLIVSGLARLGGAKEIAVSAGLARVAIRSAGDPGDIKVVASRRRTEDR